MLTNAAILLTVLGLALALRPWRLLAGATRLGPLLATLVILPWLWALPVLHAMPLQLQWSGACLAVLLLGWPLAVPVLCGVGAAAWLIAPLSAAEALDLTVWLGLVPATLASLLGAAIRRFVGTHPFVYLLGRAFLGSVACIFAAGVLAQWTGHTLPGVSTELSLVARWLMAWGDAFVTGMLVAIFVAFRPQWVATWSDPLYLHR
jgi:uncharacterized membrane protein